MEKWGYFLFFTIGTLFRKHFNMVQTILDKTPVLMICLVIFFGFNLYYVELRATHINLLEFYSLLQLLA